MYWDDKVGEKAPPTAEVSTPSPHPLVELIDWHVREERRFASTPLQPGERVMVLVTESSPLGLGVSVVPGGDSGLVYNDEAGFVPDASGIAVGVGDVVPAWVLKVGVGTTRDRVDFAFREPGAKPRLADGTTAIFDALLASRKRGEEGVLAVGDASTPAEIKLALGLSKATFKAARGALLRVGVLSFPLAPKLTKLVPAAATWTDEDVARVWKALSPNGGAVASTDGSSTRAVSGVNRVVPGAYLELAALPRGALGTALGSSAGAAALLEWIEGEAAATQATQAGKGAAKGPKAGDADAGASLQEEIASPSEGFVISVRAVRDDPNTVRVYLEWQARPCMQVLTAALVPSPHRCVSTCVPTPPRARPSRAASRAASGLRLCVPPNRASVCVGGVAQL